MAKPILRKTAKPKVCAFCKDK
ncbi:MAG: hypothetical protein QOI50_4326, partial [Pseudonocardiales bacterium]|nr:hypothetical protein [Pseudonocardiales bacterium]